MTEPMMGAVSTPAQEKQEFPSVKYEGCLPSLPKGAKINLEEKLAQGSLVTDTGVFTEFLEKYKDKTEFSQEDIDNIYKESILAGAIDHHSIDTFFSAKGVDSKKCSTQMVFDYPEAVLQLIREKGITKVETHFDSDLDAIASSYLTRSLIENGEMPVIAEDLAKVTNIEDYGLNRLDPEQYAASLPGTVSAIKSLLSDRGRAELGKEVFGNPEMKSDNGRLNAEGVQKLQEIQTKYENMRNQMVFELINAANAAKVKDSSFDISADVTTLELSEELQEVVGQGRENLKASFAEFLQDFEKAEKGKMTIKDKQGNDIVVNVVIGSSKKPLIFTNMAYNRVSPDTVVAVYAGEGRAFGDNYDIGITPDMANVMDLSAICLGLIKAEKQKRDEIIAKPDKTEDEQKMVDGWEGQADREAFFGLNDKVASGEVNADDIITKDPTVLVAGGSLIAASRTSLLKEEDFNKVFEELKK